MLAQSTVPAAETTAELVSQVQQFYHDSFTDLLWVLGAGLAVVGIVMPLVIQSLQNRSFRKRQEAELGELSQKMGKNYHQLNHYAAWLWHELAKVAFATSEWGRGIRYWCFSINGALVAEWPADDRKWDLWIASRPPDRLPDGSSRPWRLAVKGNPDVMEAVFETKRYLQKMPRKEPYTKLLAILDGLLADKP